MPKHLPPGLQYSTPDPPEGFTWELLEPAIDVGMSWPRYKRLVGPLVELANDEYVSTDPYSHALKINLSPEELRK